MLNFHISVLPWFCQFVLYALWLLLAINRFKLTITRSYLAVFITSFILTFISQSVVVNGSWTIFGSYVFLIDHIGFYFPALFNNLIYFSLFLLSILFLIWSVVLFLFIAVGKTTRISKWSVIWWLTGAVVISAISTYLTLAYTTYLIRG